ncbi:unnamed protein product, partial [Gulo gulo]
AYKTRLRIFLGLGLIRDPRPLAGSREWIRHLGCPPLAGTPAPLHQGKTHFALLGSLLRERAEAHCGPSGKEPGQEVSQTLCRLQRRRPEWKSQPMKSVNPTGRSHVHFCRVTI